MFKVNWNQVLTTVVATFLAAIIVGAAAIVWKGATTVDLKVKKATSILADTVEYTKKAVNILEKEMIGSQERDAALSEAVNEMSAMLSELRDELENDEMVKIDQVMGEVETKPIYPIYPDFQPKIPKSKLRIPKREISKPNFIQQQLPDLDVRQMAPNAAPR